LAIKYLAGERLIGTAAERDALTTGLNLINTGDAGTSYNAVNYPGTATYGVAEPVQFKASSQSGFGRCIDMPAGGTTEGESDVPERYFKYDFASSQNWIGSGDYCVGAWGKLIDTNGDQELIDLRTEGTNNYIKIYHWSANKFNALVYINNGSYDYIRSGNDNANNGNWHHFMVERSGSTHTLYIDNSSVGTWSSSNAFGTFNQIRIGRYWEGELDELFVLARTATSAEKTSMQSGVISGISSMYSDSDLKLYYNCDNTIVYPNFSNGAIFEESDTGKHQMFSGTDTWNEMS